MYPKSMNEKEKALWDLFFFYIGIVIIACSLKLAEINWLHGFIVCIFGTLDLMISTILFTNRDLTIKWRK